MNAHPKSRPKQAWEMTPAEVRSLNPAAPRECVLADLNAHRLIVEDALEVGSPVPMVVIESYPELMNRDRQNEPACMAT